MFMLENIYCYHVPIISLKRGKTDVIKYSFNPKTLAPHIKPICSHIWIRYGAKIIYRVVSIYTKPVYTFMHLYIKLKANKIQKKR